MIGAGSRRRPVRAQPSAGKLWWCRWAIVHLIGKAGHVRTIPLRSWVRQALDDWFAGAGISSGKLLRCVSSVGRAWGEGMTEKVVWHVVKAFAAKVGIANLAPHDLRRTCARLCHAAEANWNRFSFCWATFCFGADDEALLECKQPDSVRGQRLHWYRAKGQTAAGPWPVEEWPTM